MLPTGILIHKKKNGFTLIELIVSLLLIGIVIAAISAFFLFQYRTFTKGNDKSQVQSDVRISSDYITNKLRDATEISLTDSSLPNSFVLTGNSLTFNSTVLSTTVTNLDFSISPSGQSYLLTFSMTGQKGNINNFQVNSQLLLNNASDDTIADGSHSSQIYFSSPGDLIVASPIPTPTTGVGTPTPEPSPTPVPVYDSNIQLNITDLLISIKKNQERTFSVSAKNLLHPSETYIYTITFYSDDPSNLWTFNSSTPNSVTITSPNQSNPTVNLHIKYKAVDSMGRWNEVTDYFNTIAGQTIMQP